MDKQESLRYFARDLANYVVINLGLVFIWLASGGGYFWPIWSIIGWGLAIMLEVVSFVFPLIHHEHEATSTVIEEEEEPAPVAKAPAKKPVPRRKPATR